jgi:hypothetical protein
MNLMLADDRRYESMLKYQSQLASAHSTASADYSFRRSVPQGRHLE